MRDKPKTGNKMEESQIRKLRDIGLNIFPLKAKSKSPILNSSWKEYQSKRYDGKFPDTCNVGVICGSLSGNLFVIDLDDESIYDDFPDWLKNTRTIQTGKGKHLYYHYNGIDIPANRKLDDQRFRHIDIKSEGGYVLAEGSYYVPTSEEKRDGKYKKENENGFYYKLFRDLPILSVDLIKVRQALKDIGFNMNQKSLDDIKRGVGEGERDNSMFILACSYIREGLVDGALRYEMEKVNALNKPPLPDKDIDRIIESASKYESEKGEIKIREAKKIREKLEDEEPIKIKMQKIDPKIHEDVPIIFDCMISAVGDRTTYTAEAEMYCPDCGNGGKITCDEYYRFVIPKCKKCGVKYQFEKGTKITAYVQQIMIEEFLEDSRQSSPISFNAEITDESVGEAFIGDRVTLTAKFRSIPQNDGRNLILFEVLDMKPLDQQEGCMPSDDEVESWKNCPQFFDRVTNSIVPEIMINPNIIQSVILWGSGGIGLNGKREIINEAIIGSAQLGKSELLLRMHELLVGSGKTVGGRTSGAGLTIGMVKTHNGMLIPRAGFFPQHTGKHTIIDEGDKMSQTDQDVCLEIMENGTTTLTKAGVPSMTLPAKCPLLFAGNPKGGKFNPSTPNIMDNFNMKIPFISRFDIVWCMQDENDPELDRETRKYIRSFVKRKDEYMTVEELQRYFNYIQRLPCEIPDNLLDRIDDLHEKMRPLNKEDGLPIGWRQYHGLYRLITACAKANLRKVATEEDFEIVERIIKASLKSMRMDMDTGEVGALVSKTQTEEQIFLTTWTQCMTDNTIDKDEFLDALNDKFKGKLNKGEKLWAYHMKKGHMVIEEDERWKWVGNI